MKKLGFIIAMALFASFAIADIVHDLIADDPVHYFTRQPHQLLLVAAIGIVGGLLVFGCYRLSPQWQRQAKLITLGAGAIFVTLSSVIFGYQLARLSVLSGYARSLTYLCLMVSLVFLCLGTLAALLWFEFYRVFRSRVL